MPKGDKTGPSGKGPMTGRAAGYCAGCGMPGCMNPGLCFSMGLGQKRCCGFRRGWLRGSVCCACPFFSCFGPKNKKQMEEYVLSVEEELKEARKALAELDEKK